MSTPERGVYGKFYVRRVDGSPKHRDCWYFVLDPKHDAHARTALAVYADAVESDRPQLAADLRARVPDSVDCDGRVAPPQLTDVLAAVDAVWDDTEWDNWPRIAQDRLRTRLRAALQKANPYRVADDDA